ncbi:DNA repair ATPase [Hymenobacter psoromatis]|uniref:DNA repair ATPase n=1 Tax=Hymenobacter psoromatis TaxID=1484116 RepID=UPI001CBF0197|nr:DNA repair ATPase [Hymenobacter psoromatis]
MLLLGALHVSAQRSPVDEADQNINNIPRKGQRVSMQLDNKRVETAWLKQLNDQFPGKVKNNKGTITMDGVTITDISPTPVRVISRVDALPTGTGVWWSIDLGNAYLGQAATPTQWKAAEKYLKDFARAMYREDLVAQITDAEKALVTSQNNHVAVIAKADAVKKEIEKNKARKLEIQQLLGANAAELQQLNNQVDTNLKEQEAARADIVNQRVALEAVKERMGKIE